MAEISKKEVLRYLRSPLDNALSEKIDAMITLAKTAVRPASLCAVFDCDSSTDGVRLMGTDVLLAGTLAFSRLSGGKAAMFCVTLGLAGERFLAERKAESMSRYLLADAVLTAYVESAADALEQEIRTQNKETAFTARFSPGYGDFPLTAQKDILRLLNAEKYLGVRLLESYMIYPNKTVTALMGTGCMQEKAGCAACPSVCAYREEE